MFHMHPLSPESPIMTVDNCHSNITAYMPLPSLDPSDPQHATYSTRKGITKAEYLAQIKAALPQAIQHINFADPIQTRMAHETLMHEVNRDAICIGMKYSVKIEPM